MRFVTWFLAADPRPAADPEAFARTYEQRAYPQPAMAPGALRRAATVDRRSLDGFPVVTVTPRPASGRDPGPVGERHIVYLHGGSYCDPMLHEHWEIVLNLVRHTGATVTLPLYPLTPEHTHETGHAFVERVYRELLERTPADRIVLMGDSAGGGMCLAQAMRYRAARLPLPGRLILFAPWVDVRLNHPGIAAIAPRDPIQSTNRGALTARWWAGADDLTHPQVSPLFGDLAGLPPVDIYMGTNDILIHDNRILAGKIAAAGGQARLIEYPGAIHVYVGASFTPEARDTYRRIAATLGTTAVRPPVATRAATSPTVAWGRQLTVRARQRGDRWTRRGSAESDTSRADPNP